MMLQTYTVRLSIDAEVEVEAPADFDQEEIKEAAVRAYVPHMWDCELRSIEKVGEPFPASEESE